MPTRPRRFSNADIILAWTVAILWMAIIFVLSSQPGEPVGGSGRMRFGWDKLAHLVVYGVLSVIVANALTTGGLRSRRLWWTLVICAIYAVADETHQAFIPGRGPTVLDIFIDLAGSAAGYASFVLLSGSKFAQRAVARRWHPLPRRSKRAAAIRPGRVAARSMRRVALIGRTRLAVACLDVVLAAGDEIVAVIPDASDNGLDGWQPSLRRAATERGLPILDPANVNDPDFVGRVDELAPDFLLSFQAAPILRAPLIGTARVAALNLHYGPLPRYRGVSPIAWALLNGETTHGVSLHVIEPGIDTGPIVTSREVPIRPSDTGRTLYDRCVDAGVELLADAWPTVREQTSVDAAPQDEARALYYNRYAMDFSDRAVHWTHDCEAIANRIRAFIFPPLQYPEVTLRGGATYAVRAMSWDRRPHRGRPGEILEAGADGIVVGAPGGRITLRSIALADTVVDQDALAAAGLVAGALLV